MGYPQVSATHSHACTCGWLYLPCATSHTYQGKFFIYLLPAVSHLPSPATISRQASPTPSQAPCCLEPATSSPPSRGGCLEAAFAHAISHPTLPRAHHLDP